jgi:hypothetical protein
MNKKKCGWCKCPAVTSRDAVPACWWCADPGLDDCPCDACGESTPRPDADIITQAALDDLDKRKLPL